MRHSGHKARAALPWCRQTVPLPEGGARRGVHEYACPAVPPGALVMTATAAGCLVNSIFMGRGAAGQHESFVANLLRRS